MPAAFVAAVIASPVAAQEADSPPAPPVVERVNRRAPAAEGRGSESGERYRAPEVRTRERVAAAPAPAPAPAAAPSYDEDQGGRRRPSGASGGGGRVAGGGGGGGRDGGRVAVPRQGGVRNPDADGGWSGSRQAVPRGAAPRPPRGGWGSFDRRYYGNPGGFGYYLYDPWSWYGWGWPAYGAYSGWGWGHYYGGYYGGGYYGGYGAYGGPYGWAIGGVRLKVDQRDAEVYVDGYYAGTVNDFDGIWQQLRLDDGDYRIEVRKPGFETLVFDVRILPGRTITYRGEMVAVP
jgi:hypothetical protein